MRVFGTANVLVWGVVLSAAGPANAGLIVSVGNLTLTGGSSGTLDVSISGSGLVSLAGFNAEFLITPLGSAGPLLQFAASQTDPSGATNYVFYGNSSNNNLGFSPFLQTTSTKDDTLIVGDSTSNPTHPNITVGSNEILATLTVDSAGTPLTDETFSVSVVSLSTDPLFGTQFFTLDSSLASQMVDYSSTSGTVTISGAAPTGAVPEPSTLVMMLGGAMGGIICGWARKSKSRNALPVEKNSSPCYSRP